MNHKYLITIFSFISVIIISESYILWMLFSDSKKLKQEIESKEAVIETWKNRHFNIEEFIIKKIEYEDMRIPDSLHLKNEKGESINIKNLVNDSENKIIIRLSEKNCLNCILSFNSILQQEIPDVDENKIIYIADYDTEKKRDFYKKILNINTNIYTAQNIGIPIEKEELAYVFVVNNNLFSNHLFIPTYNNPELSEKYIQTVKKQLRN